MIEYLMGDIVQTFTLNQELCTLCGICVDRCEFDALHIMDDKLFFNPCKCHRCDGCETLCPNEAMSISMETINHQPSTMKEKQERYWNINSSCHISCDSICNECGRG